MSAKSATGKRTEGVFSMGFDDERDRRAEVRIGEPDFVAWRVFVNHVDSYHGKRLSSFLSDLEYSTLLEEINVEEELEGEMEGEVEEEAEDGVDEKRKISSEISRRYEVIGTAVESKYRCPEDVKAIVYSDDRASFLSELMRCGVVIYDITEEQSQIEEASWALKAIIRELESINERTPKAFKRNVSTRYFILISTVMTWALTKPLDPDDPELPFTEADYRKRKTHPNFKEHARCEKEVTIVRKNLTIAEKLKTLVICCGITYGYEENILHYLFRMAWQSASILPIFGAGDNRIPLLHIRDMIAVIAMALRNWPGLRYIVAVEQGLPTQNTIVKSISKALGTGKTRRIAREEAFLLEPRISQRIYDAMTIDLNIDSAYIVDRIQWYFDAPFENSIDAIVEEYRTSRNLRPVKIIVLGPPASGKTVVARYLARHYDVPYLFVKTLIADTIQKLTTETEEVPTQEDLDEIKNDEDEDKDTLEDSQELLDEIRNNLSQNNGRLDDAVLNKLFLQRLRSTDCLNQGYVIDGYPKTLEQAEALFEDEGRLETEEEYEDETRVVSSILPELVVALEARDGFLIDRIIDRPEREIQHTHYTEEHMIRRLREYREQNTDDNTPLQFFDEREIHPLVISIESDRCPDMFPTIASCLEKLGKPRNYGPSEEESRKQAEAEARAAEDEEKSRRERESLKCKRERQEKMMEWADLLEKLKEEEEERLCILAEPLRNYLMKYVFPTLTRGLIEVAKIRPEDPVDYLAEYLFKENPEGKMFEPDYTETVSMLFDAIESRRSDVLPKDLDEETMKILRSEGILSAVDKFEEVDTPDVCTGSTIKCTSGYGEERKSDEESEMYFPGRITDESENAG